MIVLQNGLEGQLWQIILDAYGYDEDTHLFLRQIRQDGVINWLAKRIEHIESDLVFLKHRKGLPIWDETIRDATIVRRMLEIITTGQDRGLYLGPGDDRKGEQCEFFKERRRLQVDKRYRVSGLFVVDVDGKDVQDALKKARRILANSGIGGCVIEVEELLDLPTKEKLRNLKWS